MTYAEDIVKLRLRIQDAVSAGVFEIGQKDTIEAILINIMNDAEKNRQNCVTQAENFRRQAATVDGQAAAFASTVSIVYNVINGYVKIAERQKEEEARLASEESATEAAERAEAIRLEKEAEAAEAKKTSKKTNKA